VDFRALHVERSAVLRLAAPPAQAFALFSPEGERLWAPGWTPEYLHPPNGTPQPGLVFRTAVGGETTLWLLLRYDTAACEAEYVRVTPESRIGTVAVRCAAAGADASDVHVAYRFTALSEAGNRALEQFSADAFARMMEDWRAALSRALGKA